ncbi:unnamed protein product [Sphagnum balticum]
MFSVRRPRLRLEDSQELLQQTGENVVKGGRNLWHGFTDWALQLNPQRSIAAAFTTVVTSFVSEILLPPLSLLPFINRNMEEKFAILRRGPKFNTTDGHGYNTLKLAAEDGAVVLAYGHHHQTHREMQVLPKDHQFQSNEMCELYELVGWQGG